LLSIDGNTTFRQWRVVTLSFYRSFSWGIGKFVTDSVCLSGRFDTSLVDVGATAPNVEVNHTATKAIQDGVFCGIVRFIANSSRSTAIQLLSKAVQANMIFWHSFDSILTLTSVFCTISGFFIPAFPVSI
jgi:hypothetical protein